MADSPNVPHALTRGKGDEGKAVGCRHTDGFAV
jgi:hypothetical protein